MTRKYLTIQSAYDAGRAARCAGVEKPDDACPYDRGSLRFSWWSGWYDEDTKRFLARLTNAGQYMSPKGGKRWM